MPTKTEVPCAQADIDATVSDIGAGEWVVYLLRSETRPRRTYCGATNNLRRRLRQHNGELCGGARATHAGRPWRLVGIARGFGTNASAALRFEWFCKMSRTKLIPAGSRVAGRGIEQRLALFRLARDRCKLGVNATTFLYVAADFAKFKPI